MVQSEKTNRSKRQTNKSLWDDLTQLVPLLRTYARSLFRDYEKADLHVRALVEGVQDGTIQLDSSPTRKVALLRAFHNALAATMSFPDAREMGAVDAIREAYALRTFIGLGNEEIAGVMSRSTDDVENLLALSGTSIVEELKARILIIEDEPIVAADLATILQKAGHSVLGIASTRGEATRIAENAGPDLIIADIQLADNSSGIDAVSDILVIRKVPVIFLTAYPERLLTGQRPEPTFLITKPFQPETLVAAVSQALFFQPIRDMGLEDPQESSRLRDALQSIQQNPLGVRFEVVGDAIQLANNSDASDLEIANTTLAKTLQSSVRLKAHTLASSTMRLSNQVGWEGLSNAVERLHSYAKMDEEGVALEIGSIWSVSVEIGSFLEMDDRVSQNPDSSISPLAHELRRPLEDLIRTAAPWVRMYPTARLLDDQTGAFLSKRNAFHSAAATIEIAREDSILKPGDAALLQSLVQAAERGQFQAIKAQGRTVFSAKNIVYTVLSGLLALEIGAIGSAYSTHSKFAEKAGALLGKAEAHIADLLIDAPSDVRWAYKHFSKDVSQEPHELERWRETVWKALERLGGEADLSQIYDQIERWENRPLARTWQATVRRTLGDHSKDSRHFSRIHLFDKVSSGRWRIAAPT